MKKLLLSALIALAPVAAQAKDMATPETLAIIVATLGAGASECDIRNEKKDWQTLFMLWQFNGVTTPEISVKAAQLLIDNEDKYEVVGMAAWRTGALSCDDVRKVLGQ